MRNTVLPLSMVWSSQPPKILVNAQVYIERKATKIYMTCVLTLLQILMVLNAVLL